MLFFLGKAADNVDMKKYNFLLALLIFVNVFAQEVKPLYQLPETSANVVSGDGADIFLVGSDDGLFKVTNRNAAIPLWTEGRVDQILQVLLPADENGDNKSAWFMRTSKGIIFTQDLVSFEERNSSLPFLTIKTFNNNVTSLEKQIQELKDLCINPSNHKQIVTATKDNVFLSNDGGLSWQNLGSMSKTTPGIKAVAVATIEGQTVVFMSHPIFGLSYILPEKPKATWNDVDAGFEKMPSLTSPDEISDIIPVIRTRADGTSYTEIYISQMYMPRIYKFNWQEKKGELIFTGTEPADTIDGLTIIDNVLLFTRLEGFGSLDLDSLQSPGTPANESDWHTAFSSVPGMINAAWIPQSRSGFSKGLNLCELWMLYPGTINSPYAEIANGRKSIYASAYQCRNQDGIDKFKSIIKERNMNSIVIDMKDDYGLLRYDTHDPLVMQKGSTSTYAIKDLNHFIEEFKKENIYLIARIVTFKDRALSRYQNGKYAVWDKKYNKPWIGIKGYESIKDENGNETGTETQYYDENWVDPYSEEVWEYNVAIAKELISRGFY